MRRRKTLIEMIAPGLVVRGPKTASMLATQPTWDTTTTPAPRGCPTRPPPHIGAPQIFPDGILPVVGAPHLAMSAGGFNHAARWAGACCALEGAQLVRDGYSVTVGLSFAVSLYKSPSLSRAYPTSTSSRTFTTLLPPTSSKSHENASKQSSLPVAPFLAKGTAVVLFNRR